MINDWEGQVAQFIKLSNKHNVRMIMVGGGAVNFHGYQRHSADIDFWIDMSDSNLKKLVSVFKAMGYEIEDFPVSVKEQKQNISVKFSPEDYNLELITRFSVNKTFDQAFDDSVLSEVEGEQFLKYRVLSYEDLLTSKSKSDRSKDLLDIQELKRIRKDKGMSM